MKQYLDLCLDVLKNGVRRSDRTKTGTISVFGRQARFDLRDGFPLITTKKINFEAIKYELFWFLAGNTNVKYLVDHNVNIWVDWPYAKYQNSNNPPLTRQQFIQKIKTDSSFANQHGDLGPIYGQQWVNFEGIDQMERLINNIKQEPTSRRLLVSAWNPKAIEKMLLPPCHCLFQLYVENEWIDLQLYQRSADLFLGVPFNIASYALLLTLIAKLTNYKPRYFIHTFGDLHIYENHLEIVKIQIQRSPHPLPTLEIIANNQNKLTDFKIDEIILHNYNPDSFLKAEISV